MLNSPKLSLRAAIFININIMLGTGFFINTSILTQEAGSLGASVYLIVAVLLLPLIASLAQLLTYHPESGTFYDFGRYVSPFFGFLSSWSYFTAKLCSTALGIHVCLSLLQIIIPVLKVIPIIQFDILAIGLFTLLNLLNLQIGKHIQLSFICMKLIPILFVFLSGLYLFSGAHFAPNTLIWSGIPVSIPLVLYVFTGFEASCSLSTQIIDSKKNGPLAIFISYSIAVAIVFLYQLFFYGSLGMYLGTLVGGYLDLFPALLNQLFKNTVAFKQALQSLLHLAIASSSLGSAYGIMYSNTWNLYALAKNNHTFGKKMLTSLNNHGVPYVCVFIEGLLATTYIILTQGNQLPLQQVAGFGATIAYTLSVIALLVICYQKKNSYTIPICGLISCALLFSSFVWTINVQGPTFTFILFLLLLLFGSSMFFYQKYQRKSQKGS